jgi:hypothetical protein
MSTETMEIEIFSDKNIRVTNSRIIIGATTYALRNITSVQNACTPPDTGWPSYLMLFSSLGLIGGIAWLISGETDSTWPALTLTVLSAMILTISIVWFRGLKTSYHLMISSSSQEVDALSSFHKDYISTVTEKINEAIVKCR